MRKLITIIGANITSVGFWMIMIAPALLVFASWTKAIAMAWTGLRLLFAGVIIMHLFRPRNSQDNQDPTPT